MIYAWIFITIILAFIEMITVNLVTIWFVVSGILTAVISIFVDSFAIQFSVFSVLGVLLLFTTKPILKKCKKKDVKTNFDRVIGSIGIVTEDIFKNEIGEVKVDGKKWSAISDKKIKKGSEVKILAISGVKLIVEQIEE